MASARSVLLLHSHNTGRAVQPYGHVVTTPTLARMAKEGALYRQAFAAAPTCSPSRAALMTGRHPHVAGMLGLAHRGFRMPSYEPHLARHLSRAGLATLLAGVEHTAPDPGEVGYTRILSSSDTNLPDVQNQPSAVEAAETFLQSNDRPDRFFLSVGLNETHRPFERPDPEHHRSEDPHYITPPSPLPNVSEVREDFAALHASVRKMDTAFGRVLTSLDAAGIADDTLVFAFSDHGLQFPHHMATLSDRGLGIYLIIRGPGVESGLVVNRLVSLLDVAPTIYDALGVAPPDGLNGRLLPLTSRALESPRGDEALFAESNFHAAYEPLRSIRTVRFRYVRRFDERSRPVLPNIDNSPTKAVLIKQGLANAKIPREALYDMVVDPQENTNLVSDSAYAAVLMQLRQHLEKWMKKTNDPLLQGPQPSPPGTRVDDTDADGPTFRGDTISSDSRFS